MNDGVDRAGRLNLFNQRRLLERDRRSLSSREAASKDRIGERRRMVNQRPDARR
jgi:hypothetical protein